MWRPGWRTTSLQENDLNVHSDLSFKTLKWLDRGIALRGRTLLKPVSGPNYLRFKNRHGQIINVDQLFSNFFVAWVLNSKKKI